LRVSSGCKLDPVGKLYHAPFDVHFDKHNVFQPDSVFVSKNRLSILTKAGAKGAPDFVVEILSPKTAEIDRVQKRQVYALAGVEELWIIDPEPRRIEVYVLAKNPGSPAAIRHERDQFESKLFQACASMPPRSSRPDM
jgi:Uma2 family endonuclease